VQAGDVIAERYRIDVVLGRGGFGEVWRSWDLRMSRTVAVKVLVRSTADGGSLFRREVETVARLNHPHVVTVHDCGEHEGAPYLVMEFLDGLDLAAALRANGPPALPTGLRWCAEVGDALDAAHTAGIVHRDMKPANVVVTASGVKLVDFGVARYAEGVTTGSRVMHTPAYTAPERFRGERGDARTDLYAFGCLVYEVLTGETLFPGLHTSGLMFAHLNTTPPPPSRITPGVPRTVDDLVRTLLAKDAAERTVSAAAAAEILRTAAGSLGGHGHPPLPDPTEPVDPTTTPAPVKAPSTPTPRRPDRDLRPGTGNARAATRPASPAVPRGSASEGRRTGRARWWLGGIAVLALAGSGAWLMSLGRGDADPTTPADRTPARTTAGITPGATGQTSMGALPPYVGPTEVSGLPACRASDLEVSLHANLITPPAGLTTPPAERWYGEPVQLMLTMQNRGDQPCVIDLSKRSAAVEIRSGDERVWSSADCTQNQPELTRLQPGGWFHDMWMWDWTRSDPNRCTGLAPLLASPPPVPGGTRFTATARVDGLQWASATDSWFA
jgi:hypothetical protein